MWRKNIKATEKTSAIIELNEITGRTRADFCIGNNATSGAPSENCQLALSASQNQLSWEAARVLQSKIIKPSSMQPQLRFRSLHLAAAKLQTFPARPEQTTE